MVVKIGERWVVVREVRGVREAKSGVKYEGAAD
jgi:hypothetical protein